MSGQVAERDIIAAPPVRHAGVSRRQLGLAGAALLIGIGAAWYGDHWWTIGRFLESTDDAYVGGDVTVIAPKVSGFIADVAVNCDVLSGGVPDHLYPLVSMFSSERGSD